MIDLLLAHGAKPRPDGHAIFFAVWNDDADQIKQVIDGGWFV
ncbi:MAG: hypothetical protein R3F11_17595 [Verrucomicrobiales bacterium]